MAKENDAPTEIETITLTMSRPVAEAVQAACEWYLRLHMGQFWDVADDLCMAKFYSDAKHNEFKTKVGTTLSRFQSTAGTICRMDWITYIAGTFSLPQSPT